MEENILIIGLKYELGLELLSTISRNLSRENNIYMLEEEYDMIKSELTPESTNEIGFKKDLSKFSIIDLHTLQNNNISISIWCYANIYDNFYYSDYQEKIDALLLCNSLHIKEINYILHQCQFRSKEYHFSKVVNDKLLKLSNLGKESVLYTQKQFSEYAISTNVYIIPVINKHNTSFYSDFMLRYYEFEEWITSRVPDYFDNNILKLIEKTYVFNTMSSKECVNAILKHNKKCKAGEYHELTIGNEYSTYIEKYLCKQNQSKKGKIKSESDIHNISDVDQMFANILGYHMPYSLSHGNVKEKNKKEGIIDIHSEENNISGYLQTVNSIDISTLTKKSIILENNEDLVYYTSGRGMPIYIVNAYGVAVDAWVPLISLLAKNFYVIIGEGRGIKDNELPILSSNEKYDVFDHVNDIEIIIEHEKIDKHYLISWCSGAKQAIFYCDKHNDKVISQIILAGEYAPYKNSEEAHSNFRKNVQDIYKIIEHDDRLFDFYMKIINRSIFKNSIDYQGLLKKVQVTDSNNIATALFEIIPDKDKDIILGAFTNKEKMRNFLTMCVEYYKYDVEENISSLSLPTLLIAAQRDNVANPKQSEWAHSIFRNSVLLTFPEATHSFIKERYRDIYNEIFIFLQNDVQI